MEVAKNCLNEKHFRDAINRSYYAAFYAIKSVLALEKIDFKRHKDVIAYFNQHYIKNGPFDRELGKKIGRLKQIREDSDYDDFYIASKEQAEAQIETATEAISDADDYIQSFTNK